MCGIDGAIRLAAAGPPLDPEAQRRIRAHQARRGPDGEGEWTSPDGRVLLGHRRLAILDLSPTGAQPMVSADGALVLTINGEIYNFRALREELLAQGVTLRSTGDTEVLLALYARHGEAAFARLRGMFALALWDGPRRRLLLARDPLGIKPLYYGADPAGTLRFASQVKGLEAAGVASDLDPAGLVGFLLFGAVPEPHTIRRAVRALPAGHLLRIDLPAGEPARVGTPEPYCPAGPWPAPASPLTVADALEESVRLHLESDVPVGIFLSAGLDSALVAALARRVTSAPPLALTVAFHGREGTALDETPLAAEVASALGLRHQVLRLDLAGLAARWPAVLAAMDQPSIDGANTYLVSEAAHAAGAKVVLSGLGGDELFGSYPSFRQVPRLVRLAAGLARLPGADDLWRLAGRLLADDRPKLQALPALGRDLAGAYLLCRGLFLPDELAGLLPASTVEEGLATLQPLASLRRDLEALGSGIGRSAADGRDGGAAGASGRAEPTQAPDVDSWLAVHHLETVRYMRHQLLRDSDWASMAHSLELRVPLVDPILRAHLAAARFAPARRHGKAALVRTVAPEVPAALFARRKTGFHVPLAESLVPALAGRPHGVQSRELARRVLAAWLD